MEMHFIVFNRIISKIDFTFNAIALLGKKIMHKLPSQMLIKMVSNMAVVVNE